MYDKTHYKKKKKITSSLPPTASLSIPQAGHEGEITSEETASLHSMENDTEPNILRSMIHWDSSSHPIFPFKNCHG